MFSDEIGNIHDNTPFKIYYSTSQNNVILSQNRVFKTHTSTYTYKIQKKNKQTNKQTKQTKTVK